MKKIFIVFLVSLITLLISFQVDARGRLQDQDFKTLSELTSAGATASALLNDTKVFVSSGSINEQLSASITDGKIFLPQSSLDLGSSSQKFKDGYFSGVLKLSSGSFTTGIQGSASATASKTYTLPITDGSAGYVLSTNGSAVTSWIAPPAAAYSYTSKSNDYTVLDNDGYTNISMTVTGKTITLPTAANNTNRIIEIIDSISGDSTLTIKGAASGETVNGISGSTGIVLYTYQESVKLLCTGSVWVLLNHHIPNTEVSFTGVTAAFDNCTVTGFKSRHGDKVKYRLNAKFSTNPTTTGGFSFLTFPDTMNTAKMTNATDGSEPMGMGNLYNGTTGDVYAAMALYRTSTSTYIYQASVSPAATVTKTSPFNFPANSQITINIEFPVVGWWE